MNFLAHAVDGGYGEVVLDALEDSALIIPAVFLLHVVMALIHRHKKRTPRLMAGGVSPLLGAMLGSVPQCGVGVAAAKMYENRYMSMGALAAVLVSSSDEAMLLFLTRGRIVDMLPVLAIKLGFALVLGYAVLAFEYSMRKKGSITITTVGDCDCGCNNQSSGHDCMDEAYSKQAIAKKRKAGCGCGEGTRLEAYLLHPLKHSLIIFAYCLIINLIIGLAIMAVTVDRLADALSAVGVFQPLIASIFALIPGCAPSLIVADLYIDGLISLGSTVAALSVASGMALPVLIKNRFSRAAALRLLPVIVACSVVLGMVIDLIVK